MRDTILILGGTGKLGRALARVWPDDLPALWQHRPDSAAPTTPAVAWDILNSPAPLADLEQAGVTGILALAGYAGPEPDLLAQNTPLAQAAAHLGKTLGCRVLVASSQAVYGPRRGLLHESSACAPQGGYGAAKLAMEGTLAGQDHVTCLRIGNVAGCDALAAGIADATPENPVTLDRFADGQGPRRAMIGAADLMAMMPALFAAPDLPPVLNVARAGSVDMADVLDALGQPFVWRDAGPDALPDLRLDVTLLQGICAVPDADAAAMAQQGWPV
ncbi:NAD-dependent epimerase/dehydratase [Loktanella sp. TSTF-M6]|uniref:NAD-dependent epimerase/dehydratase n=1 Tax=Loktanella gaetbuli TaxID=2881335 RepID=A0ABS8BY65_9RHOB|nr:NAD-dependent epimerase/dehydratase family protein [Loktanella gaetbuli]MCB5200681.1 NAD-dependent epimerase/dehydratase [Loktanella gaetbuli]